MRTSCFIFALAASALTSFAEGPHMPVLLIDGQNNHAWPYTSPIIMDVLETEGVFQVAESQTPQKLDPKASEMVAKANQIQWDDWRPFFKNYRAVVSNYNGQDWPEPVQKAFEAYVADGGGFVCIHAADNAFPNWPEYNKMIGVGGWGGRTDKDGPRLYLEDGKIIRDTSPGPGGSHGPQGEFLVTMLNPNHPITKGLPLKWMHSKDELYNSLRGPAENVEVLATATSDQTHHAEPVVMTVTYGKGRIFHITLGHADYSMACKGFQILLRRGTEWAATGAVQYTAKVPTDLPTENAVSPPPQPSAK